MRENNIMKKNKVDDIETVSLPSQTYFKGTFMEQRYTYNILLN